MPTPQLSAPGVYIQEIPSGSRAITGVATAITAFVGRTLRGPSDEPVQIGSFGEFERTFGGLWRGSGLGYAVRDYYLNGGGNAVVVRIASGANVAGTDANGLKLAAVGPGLWGNKIRVEVTAQTEEEEAAAAAAAAAAARVDQATAALERAQHELADTADKAQGAAKGAKRSAADQEQREKEESVRRASEDLERAKAAQDAADRANKAEQAVAADIAERQGVQRDDVFHLRVLEVDGADETQLEALPNVTTETGPRRIDRVLANSPVLRVVKPLPADAVVKAREDGVGITNEAKISAGDIAVEKLTGVSISDVTITNATTASGKVTGTITAGKISAGNVTGIFSGPLEEGTTKIVQTTTAEDSGVTSSRVVSVTKGKITGGRITLGAITGGDLSGLKVTEIPFTGGSTSGSTLTGCTIANATVEGPCIIKDPKLANVKIVGDTKTGSTSTEGQPADPAPPLPTPFRIVADLRGGDDGGQLGLNDYNGQGYENSKRGLYALEKADLFTLLCLPPSDPAGDLNDSVWTAAVSFCARRNAFLLIDPPRIEPKEGGIGSWLNTVVSPADIAARNAALYYPRLRCPDPLQEGAIDVFVPSGAIAGVMARTDTNRGVWKAPAGLEAGIAGASGLAVDLTDSENGRLPKSVNCLRTFRNAGSVVWGSRTVRGSDVLADEYKYVPVRRLSLFLKESLCRGTQWVVFEPNDEPLWSQIRTTLGAFMQDLFRQGAFQGRAPREAYFVKCDSETTTQYDIDRGIVNIQVGFAPLKPAEFVVISIQQKSATTPA